MDGAGKQRDEGNLSFDVHRLDGKGGTLETRMVPEEVPVALLYNGVSHVVMMMTPTHFKEFVVGFSLTEGLIRSPEELGSLELQVTERGVLLKAELPEERVKLLATRMRGLAGQTGCGVCGLIDLENVARPLPNITTAPHLSFDSAQRALHDLHAWQPLNAESGAHHAAAFANKKGIILKACEDVGRHNALDKLIGTLALERIDPREGFVLLSSRCSYELAQKAIAAGIGALVTISAPTDFAIRIAQEHDLTLIALARPDSMLCFNDPFEIFNPNS